MTAPLSRDAPGLSASTISRLKESWQEQHRHGSRRYVYPWLDSIPFRVRLEDAV